MYNKPELPDVLNESTVFDFGALMDEERAFIEWLEKKQVPKEKSLFERVISGEFNADTTASRKPIITRKKEEATHLYEYILLQQLERQANGEDIAEDPNIKPHRNLPPDQHLIEAGIKGKYTGEYIPEGNPFGPGGAYEYIAETIKNNKR